MKRLNKKLVAGLVLAGGLSIIHGQAVNGPVYTSCVIDYESHANCTIPSDNSIENTYSEFKLKREKLK